MRGSSLDVLISSLVVSIASLVARGQPTFVRAHGYDANVQSAVGARTARAEPAHGHPGCGRRDRGCRQRQAGHGHPGAGPVPGRKRGAQQAPGCLRRAALSTRRRESCRRCFESRELRHEGCMQRGPDRGQRPAKRGRRPPERAQRGRGCEPCHEKCLQHHGRNVQHQHGCAQRRGERVLTGVIRAQRRGQRGHRPCGRVRRDPGRAQCRARGRRCATARRPGGCRPPRRG